MNPEEIIYLCDKTRYKLRELQDQNRELYALMEQLADATRGAAQMERVCDLLRQSGQDYQRAMDATDNMLQTLRDELKLLLAGIPPIPPITLP